MISQAYPIKKHTTTHSILLNEVFSLGLGVGVEPFEYLVFPVFISSSYYFNRLKHKPFITFKIGNAFSNSDKPIPAYSYRDDIKHKGGMMVNPEIGIRLKISTFDLTLTGGYRFQRLKSDNVSAVYTYHHDVDYNRVSFAIGVLF